MITIWELLGALLICYGLIRLLNKLPSNSKDPVTPWDRGDLS